MPRKTGQSKSMRSPQESQSDKDQHEVGAIAEQAQKAASGPIAAVRPRSISPARNAVGERKKNRCLRKGSGRMGLVAAGFNDGDVR